MWSSRCEQAIVAQGEEILQKDISCNTLKPITYCSLILFRPVESSSHKRLSHFYLLTFLMHDQWCIQQTCILIMMITIQNVICWPAIAVLNKHFRFFCAKKLCETGGGRKREKRREICKQEREHDRENIRTGRRREQNKKRLTGDST